MLDQLPSIKYNNKPVYGLAKQIVVYVCIHHAYNPPRASPCVANADECSSSHELEWLKFSLAVWRGALAVICDLVQYPSDRLLLLWQSMKAFDWQAVVPVQEHIEQM